MLILFCLGLVNSFLFFGDILKDYAMIGLIIYALKNLIIRFRSIALIVLFLLTIGCLLFIENDMKNVGSITDLVKTDSVFLANFKYSIYLNLSSKYYLVCYHIQMLLLVLTGFYAGYFGINKTYLWCFKRPLYNFWSYLMADGMILSFLFLFHSHISTFGSVLYFLHILFFSIWYMTGFSMLVRDGTLLNKILSKIGRRTLTIYFIQNLILCSIWFLSSKQISQGLIINSIYFLGLQIGILLIFLINKSFLKKSSWIENLWRKLAAGF
ncbi:hypothetical protein SAMN04515674_1059 [Pseudarcicella hirudinis]|uniref:DUF418 domain-containing protein n=1 Tax=Pseudarcicella hirudinis TaxID=1079859 RepID=A0A1I5SFY6_9BACT|nr:hypothetical protein SAMN04515674_1059 [Pseudarcicella hirudinis]